MSSHDTTAAGPSKVAIPRLQPPRSDPPKKSVIKRQSRASRACLSCRSRKIKCNGNTPRCSNCKDASAPCIYASSRKDRLRTSTFQNQEMMALLYDLRPHVAGDEQSKIDRMLAQVTEDVIDAAATIQRSPEVRIGADIEHEGYEEEPGEAAVSAEVGSSTDLDMLDEDLMKDERTRATGFIGKASEIQWLRQLRPDNAELDGPYGPPGESSQAAGERLMALRQRQGRYDRDFMLTNKASYYLDDELLALDLEVDPHELPPFECAQRLVHAYIETCHNTFPVLVKRPFMNQFYHYYAAVRRGKSYDPPRKWQAQLNLVLAIAAVYSHLTLADWREDERDHLIYHSRAWALSLKDPWWFSHPDLPQMQITGLLSFYYMSIGHINRSWVLIGMSLRFGYALGLHVRNEDRATGAARKEELARIWWGHSALERHLAIITGRPSVGLSKSCSVPLPLPLPSSEIVDAIIESRFGDHITKSASFHRGQSTTPAATSQSSNPASRTSNLTGLDTANSGSYLKSLVGLGEIGEEALNLYRASTVVQSWQSIQDTVSQLADDLEGWASTLPIAFKFLDQTLEVNDRYHRERATIKMLFYSIRILVTRPCLCRLDRRIRNQTARSNEFNHRMSAVCVDSAKAVAGLLPAVSELNLRSLYESGPWWSMVHTIMQSLVVLLLEVSFDATRFPEDSQEVIPPLKKLIRWLRTMRVHSRMAVRAYTIVMDLLRKVSSTTTMNISDIFYEDNMSNFPGTDRDTFAPKASMHDTWSSVDTTGDYLQADNPGLSTATNPSVQSQTQYTDSHATMSNTWASPALQGMHGASAPALGFSFPGNTNLADEVQDDIFANVWGTSDSVFSSLFYTSFDEQNPFPGFGLDDFESFDNAS